ncbi:hypothetical protein D9619_010810 [Psilocybe cf. subviscida]|uniref:Endonuclease/exonuclease/phosphatase domain-containing protein n=1 Tax=Psilocybe cf. subviscida TaxID=2480587 RepID=A0A8H5B7Z5_9AGAR|nr:hypothetical protein D9619_010810 [Psilocybe cf. subviscida]
MACPPEPDSPPHVLAYISKQLSAWRPSMRRDIIDHHDILILFLFAEGQTFSFMNVYSDSEFTAIKLLADCMDSLPQFQYMGGNFNSHNSLWDPVPCAANVAASHWLLSAAQTIGLELDPVSNPGPTHIPRDASKHPSVIDLVFLPVALTASVTTEHVTDAQSDSDHILLLTIVPVSPAVHTALRRCLPSDPEKVQAFLDDLVAKLCLIAPDDVAETPDEVEATASAVASAFSEVWLAHSRDSNVMQCSNPWWNKAYAIALQQHCTSHNPADWAHFRHTVKSAKRMFFNTQIAEIAVKSKRPWDLMNWVQQHKLRPCEAIQYQGQPCHEMSALWDALHGTYNAASGRACDMTVLDSLPDKPVHGSGPHRVVALEITCEGHTLFQLWYFAGAKNKTAIKTLNKMQQQAALWITGAFRTSPGGSIEALAGLMPLHMTLAKLSSGSVTRVVSLSDTHPVRSLMSGRHLKPASPHACFIELMTPALKARVKGSLMQADTILPTAVENMDPFHALAQPGLRLLDCFCDCIVFDTPSRSSPLPPPPPGDGPSAEEILDAQMWANALIRDKINVPEEMGALAAMPVPKSAHIKPVELEGDADTSHAAADGSLPTSERLQATAAVIIQQQTEQLHQNHFVAGRVTAHDAELYAIRSAVVQCTQHDAKRIVIFTDAIGSARVAVDPSPHSGQAHSLAVCAALQGWLQGDEERTITFVNVPSALRWSLHVQAHQYATQLRVPLGQDPVLTINSIRQTTDLWRKQEWKTKFLHSPLPGAAFLQLRGVDGTQL